MKNGPKSTSTPPRPPADHHERRETKPATSVDVDRHRGHETADRVASNGPRPMPEEVVERRRRRDAVPLADLPDEQDLARCLDGESEPNTASWRTHHGAMTRTKPATRAERRAKGMAGVRDPGRAPRPPAIPERRRDRRREHEQAVVARQGRQPGEQPGQRRRRAASRGARARPSTARRRPAAGTARSCRAGPCRRSTAAGTATRKPAPTATNGARPGVAGDRPGQRRRGRADQRERQRGRPGDVAEEPQERHLDDAMRAASSGHSRGSAGSGRRGIVPPTSGKIQMKSTLNP